MAFNQGRPFSYPGGSVQNLPRTSVACRTTGMEV